MFYLNDKIEFPDANSATDEGIVAFGGDLSPERLFLAYKKGIFPWFDDDDEMIMWWSPDPRMVLFPTELRISKSMKKILSSAVFTVTFNTCFETVIENCAAIERKDEAGTWITKNMKESYIALFKKGIAKSVEVWQDDILVGGLYGIDLGTVFCGESMFSKVSNASKAGFITLVQKLKQENYNLIDCQMHTNHLESLGAREIDREAFLSYLE